MTIKLRINEILEAQGKSAYWLANEIGVDHSTLSQIRNNKNKSLNLEYLEKICDALECAPGDLFVRDEEVKPSKKARR